MPHARHGFEFNYCHSDFGGAALAMSVPRPLDWSTRQLCWWANTRIANWCECIYVGWEQLCPRLHLRVCNPLVQTTKISLARFIHQTPPATCNTHCTPRRESWVCNTMCWAFLSSGGRDGRVLQRTRWRRLFDNVFGIRNIIGCIQLHDLIQFRLLQSGLYLLL